jgi:hypothetical protein
MNAKSSNSFLLGIFVSSFANSLKVRPTGFTGMIVRSRSVHFFRFAQDSVDHNRSRPCESLPQIDLTADERSDRSPSHADQSQHNKHLNHFEDR